MVNYDQCASAEEMTKIDFALRDGWMHEAGRGRLRLGPIYKSVDVALIAAELVTRQTELLEVTVCCREARTART